MPGCARVSVCYLSMRVVCAHVSRGEQRVRASESGRFCNLFISGASFQRRHSWCHGSAPIDGWSRWVTVACVARRGMPGRHGRGPSGSEWQWAKKQSRSGSCLETVRRGHGLDVVICWIWTRRPRALSHTHGPCGNPYLASSARMPDTPLDKGVFCWTRVMSLCRLLDDVVVAHWRGDDKW